MIRFATVAALLVYIVVSLGGDYLNDRASCERHNVLVPAIHQYPIDAALAREQSATLEMLPGPHFNPGQARIDREAAWRFRADAVQTRALDCSGPLPATH